MDFLRKKLKFSLSKKAVSILFLLLITLSIPITIATLYKGQFETRTRALETNNFSRISPGKSTLDDVLVVGKSVGVETVNDRMILSYATQSEDYQDQVVLENGVVAYTLSNIFSGNLKDYADTSLTPDLTLYDKTDDNLVWKIYLSKGLALVVVDEEVMSKISFSPMNPNSFNATVGESIGLSSKKDPIREDFDVVYAAEDENIVSEPTVGASSTGCAGLLTDISDKYGARVIGDYTCSQLRKIDQVYAVPFRKTKYVNLLKPHNKFTIHLLTDKPNDGFCRGYVSGRNDIYIYDFGECSPSLYRAKSIIYHETAHLIKNRNYRKLYQQYTLRKLVRKDKNCYDQSFLKVYPLRNPPYLVSAKSESMAEAAALYYLNEKNGALGRINDFKKECPNTYSYIEQKLYNDPPPPECNPRTGKCPL